MKTQFFSLRRWFTVSALSLASLGTVSAQEPGTVQTPPAHTDASAGVKLPYGVEDVVKLTKAQVGEEIILSYVQNSGTIYNLTPHEIVYLRDQGVSNPVINAMVNQQRRSTETAAQTAPQTTQAPVYQDNASAPAQNYAQTQPAYAPQASQPASSVYVIPYTSSSYAYSGYGYSPYYYYGGYRPYYGYGYGYPSYGYYGPSIGFSFGFGGGHGHYGYYHGGSHAYHHH